MILRERDLALLRLLDKTPATAALIVKASATFGQEAFLDERRARERLQTLESCGLLRSFTPPYAMGSSLRWYKLSRDGFLHLHGAETSPPSKSQFANIPPSRIEHTHVVAEVIVHSLVAAHQFRLKTTTCLGDGALVVDIGFSRQAPDCFFQFQSGGKTFNVLFEVDNGTEPLTTNRIQSIRSKITTYEAYQDAVRYDWKRAAEFGTRPRFRVAFLTKSADRANHILWLARETARNPDRRLCYAATQDTYLAESDALRAPLFNDHHGHWQSLVNTHPTSQFLRTPIRLAAPMGNVAHI